MRGDVIVIRDDDRRVASTIADRLLPDSEDRLGRYGISVAGESGSGKSTIAAALAEAFEQRGIRAAVIQQDDYFVRPPRTNDAARRRDISWVGPQEVRLDLLDRHMRLALDGAERVTKPLVLYEADAITEEVVDLGGVKVVIVEGTYVTGLPSVDCRVFIARDRLDTMETRRTRGREAPDPFIEEVLEIEHRLLCGGRAIADIVIGRDYDLEFRQRDGTVPQARAEPMERDATLARSIDAYCSGRTSFVGDLLPERALALSAAETLALLRRRFGGMVDVALDVIATDPDQPASTLSDQIRSPVASEPDGSWLKTANIVGINVRTVASFWSVVKYALTLPLGQSAIHLLPIWEPGVVGSIYGPSSWNLNREFFDRELAEQCPWLDSVGRQLRAVVNLLHVMGRTVGMDVIPHVDRFSEIVLAQPHLFEWLQRDDRTITSHADDLDAQVRGAIFGFLVEHGPAIHGSAVPSSVRALFDELDEDRRLELLFGTPGDPEGRHRRRVAITRRLHELGYEPVPATMAPPYRGLAVDNRDSARFVDAEGMAWRDFYVTRPQPMSRVFGPLARYRLYEARDGNRDWEIDFERPRREAWQYVCRKYADVQRRYGFDFMRGDMAHVQMRPEGVTNTVDGYYDILGAVKRHVREECGVPHFAYLAESFLAARDVMMYGEEMDHLEASGADAVLGDLQSTAVATPRFVQRIRQYDDFARTRRCVPCLTVMTADKDDPRFDDLYLDGNEVRLFVALFMAGMPSYMGLGFEVRDAHSAPAPNEHYTKLFVFRESEGPHAVRGPYVWGRNTRLFRAVTAMRTFLDEIRPAILGSPGEWLIPPDATGERRVIAWTHGSGTSSYLFLANLDTDMSAKAFGVPSHDSDQIWVPAFSTAPDGLASLGQLVHNGAYLIVPGLAPGEGRVYRR